MDVAAFAHEHLDGVLRLCVQEGWTTFPTDPVRAERALSAPGAIALVALIDGEVVGFAQALTDGQIQAYLCLLVVAAGVRRQGIGRRLVTEVLTRSGAMRLDVLATAESRDFYVSFPHQVWHGYCIHPPQRAGDGF